MGICGKIFVYFIIRIILHMQCCELNVNFRNVQPPAQTRSPQKMCLQVGVKNSEIKK